MLSAYLTEEFHRNTVIAVTVNDKQDDEFKPFRGKNYHFRRSFVFCLWAVNLLSLSCWAQPVSAKSQLAAVGCSLRAYGQEEAGFGPCYIRKLNGW